MRAIIKCQGHTIQKQSLGLTPEELQTLLSKNMPSSPTVWTREARMYFYQVTIQRAEARREELLQTQVGRCWLAHVALLKRNLKDIRENGNCSCHY